MELRHLRYFVAVADEMNFTRAAEKLRLAQPSLTRQIHNLEAELGVQLLDRTKNQVSLTQEGTSFLVDARRLVALSLESMKSVQRVSRGESGQLNLGYLVRFNFGLLPTTLASFYLACPNMAANLFDMSPAEQLSALEARRIDLGFMGLRPPAPSKNMKAQPSNERPPSGRREFSWRSRLRRARKRKAARPGRRSTCNNSSRR
jgi:DNA-binding transcriptional LysR family regulator